MRERPGVARALRSGVATADDRQTWTIQQLNAPRAIQQRRGIAYFEQRFRIFRMIPGDQRPAWCVGPFKRARNAFCNVFGIQRVKDVRRDKRRQCTASGSNDGFRETEATQQITQRGRAQAGRQRKLQPGGERLA